MSYVRRQKVMQQAGLPQQSATAAVMDPSLPASDRAAGNDMLATQDTAITGSIHTGTIRVAATGTGVADERAAPATVTGVPPAALVGLKRLGKGVDIAEQLYKGTLPAVVDNAGSSEQRVVVHARLLRLSSVRKSLWQHLSRWTAHTALPQYDTSPSAPPVIQQGMKQAASLLHPWVTASQPCADNLQPAMELLAAAMYAALSEDLSAIDSVALPVLRACSWNSVSAWQAAWQERSSKPVLPPYQQLLQEISISSPVARTAVEQWVREVASYTLVAYSGSQLAGSIDALGDFLGYAAAACLAVGSDQQADALQFISTRMAWAAEEALTAEDPSLVQELEQLQAAAAPAK